jgi:tetratricopeptide (TPR) repeat protein
MSALRFGSVLVAALAVLCLVDVWATCGGGGGGGTGGMGSGMSEEVYQVPWKNIKLGDTVDPSGLVVYWFPASQNELEHSSLRNSRMLSLYASQCVTLGVADSKSQVGEKFAAGETLPVAVLAQPDGKVIGKAQHKDGFLRVAQVEKLVDAEIKLRETAVKDALKQGKDNAKKKENDAAIAKLKSVVDQKCLFPNHAKDAAKELKKLGIEGAPIAGGPVFDPAKSARIERTMRQGLAAENRDKYAEAEKLYTAAHRLDPADPAPMRYLGEVYRHHLGDWDKARQVFNGILSMPADPLSRAVALHGLGKMTIHDGEFKKGLALMEDAARVFPLALTYRNLAVYWNSEGDAAKRDAYTAQAVAIDPADPFNIVFAAANMAGSGRAAEALKIAGEHDSLLCASYNLAAIYAQAGQKDKALALLKRHFYEYERYPSVRSKEMMEARVDAVFASLYQDPAFIALTAEADGKLPLPKMGGGGRVRRIAGE